MLLLVGKRLLQDKVSRQWQYYIWLIVILRLLLPFGPERTLPIKTTVRQTVTQAELLPQPIGAPAAGMKKMPIPTEARPHSLPGVGTLLAEHLWLAWLAAALGLLTRKATAYRRFLRCLKAGLTPVSDLALLNRLSIIAGQAGRTSFHTGFRRILHPRYGSCAAPRHPPGNTGAPQPQGGRAPGRRRYSR